MTKRYLTIPAVVAGALGLSSFARAGDTQQPTTDDLRKQIEQLQARVQQMESQQSINAKAVDDTVERVLRDADRRSQLMQMEGFTAGFDQNTGRFVVGSADSESRIMPYLQMQFRTSTNFDTSGDDNTENGFSLPRVKLGFDGSIFTNRLEYYFRWNSGDSDGGGSGPLNLEQAWLRYQWNDQWAFRAGQFVDPVFHEQLVNSDRQLAADRSLVNTIITGADESYTQGVTAIWSPDATDHRWNVEIGFTDGVNTGNTSFRDFPTGPADFGVAGRVEYVANGNKGAYHDFTAMHNSEDLLVIGGGADWTQSGDTDNFLHTVDVQWEGMDGRLGVYGAYIGQYIRNGGGSGITGVTGGTDDHYNWGALVQAGYMLDQNWEVFGRYDYTHLEDEIAIGTAGSTEDTFHEVTGGVNYYFRGHHAKITVDVSWLPSGAPDGASNLGILGSDDDEFVIRGQFQIML